ncbi:Nucleoplasmin [Carabus blaptoides fortunei]
MADEYFYALTLQGAKASECWDPESKGAEDYQGGHKLVIRQALLGPEAKDGEVNVVQVEAMTWKDSITIPVATLSAGANGTSQCLLDLSFPDPPVTFSLLQGSGPVHIIGHHLIGSPMEDSVVFNNCYSENNKSVPPFQEAGNNIKRKRNNKANAADEEDEEEDDEGPKKKAKTATNSKGKAPVAKNKKK